MKALRMFGVLTGMLLTFLPVRAQVSTDWFSPGQPYVKMMVREDGMYRVSYEELARAGLPVAGAASGSLRLFFRGREAAIMVGGATDGSFDPGDFIEFYGLRNDGTLDAEFYKEGGGFQTNPFWNLYSDQTAWFLTISPEGEGKRIGSVRPEQVNNFTWQEYHMQEEIQMFFQNFNNGNRLPGDGGRYGGFRSDFFNAKGYVGTPHLANRLFFPFRTPGYYPEGRSPQLEAFVSGWNNLANAAEYSIGPTRNAFRAVGTASFSNRNGRRLLIALSHTDFNTTTDSVYVSARGTGQGNIVTSALRLIYPQRLQTGIGNRRRLNFPSGPDNLLIELPAQLAAATRAFDISSVWDVRLLEPLNVAGRRAVALTQAAPGRRVWIEEGARPVEEIRLVNFRAFEPMAYNYLIVTHPLLRRPVGSTPDPVQAYADYRASQQGGSHRVLITEIDELYNRFAYGEATPLAIRNFARFMLERGAPKFMFLIGKGLDLGFQYERNKPASLEWAFQSLIPCYGRPCSDNEFSSGLNGATKEPAIPTGRLSVMRPEQVIAYLNKVKEHEDPQVALQPWRKRFLHLNGGASFNEIALFRRYVELWKQVAEGIFVGAEVDLLSKRTSTELEFINIVDGVNQGYGLMTFFGHSSATAADIDVGFASDLAIGYRNRGRYPALLMNGCLSGNIFSNFVSFGEDWVNVPERGAVLMTAHVDVGFSATQFSFTNMFYNTAFTDSSRIFRSFGEMLQITGQRFLEGGNLQNDLSVANVQQFVLQGDPAVRIFFFDRPDYTPSQGGMTLRTFGLDEPLTSKADSIQLIVPVRNLGMALNQTFEFLVRRTFEDGTVQKFLRQWPRPVFNTDTLRITLLNDEATKRRGAGNNIFEIILDPNDSIPEINEQNNSAVLQIFLPRGAMNIISPVPFGIVNQAQVNLVAENTDFTTGGRNYTFQIDTTARFNSPLRRDTVVFSGQLPRWPVVLPATQPDSLVYYWRARLTNPARAEDTLWAESSFAYIRNSQPGWTQRHFFQLQSSDNIGMELGPDRNWSFLDRTVRIKVRVPGAGHPEANRYVVEVNGKKVVEGNCGTDRLLMVQFNRFTGRIQVIDWNVFGTYLTCGAGFPGSAAFFSNSVIRTYNVMSQIRSRVPVGDYLLFIPIGEFDFTDLIARDFAAMQGFGFNTTELQERIREKGAPAAFFTRNGRQPGQAEAIYPDPSRGPARQQLIEAEFSIPLIFNQATLTSPLIGPARTWEQFSFQINQRESPVDIFNFDLIGVTLQGQETVLQRNVTARQTLTGISAAQHPYLKLRLNVSDTLRRTPMQLRNWSVTYTPVPEAILVNESLASTNDFRPTFQEGETLDYRLVFTNVSPTAFQQPIVVSYQLQNLTTGRVLSYFDTLGILRANESVQVPLTLNTTGWIGENRLTVYANPRLQPEQLYDNNIQVINFRVSRDVRNPLLDVTFDGIRIMNGDIVSPTPLIAVNLRDEANAPVKADTVGLNMFLSACDSCANARVVLSSPNVTYEQTPDGTFRLLYRPDKLEDGRYTLSVQGEDASGNRAGVVPYQVSFEVISKASVTHFYPYPNPFSDRVRFVFTLTGSQLPDELKIQIMTVTGRVVREIMMDEIGPLRIGHNITEYAWDGRDEFGDQLANGVYLYRVVMRSAGESYEKRETAGDKFFKHGIGKLYLMK